VANYAQGTALTLTANTALGVTFAGWTGPCVGTGSCSFSVAGIVSVTAQFHAIPSEAQATTSVALVSGTSGDGANISTVGSNPLASSTGATQDDDVQTQTSSPALPNHVIFAQIQIAGASSSNDFVKLYNPTAASVDMSGWRLRKKSSTGTDYSLRDMPKGTIIASGAYFTWANSLGEFAQSINADASSTETIAADNSIAIMDANSSTIDAVAWGNGTNQYGEGPPFATNPVPNQLLVRKNIGGVMIDANDNAHDFILQ
jgi:hypothetical protein